MLGLGLLWALGKTGIEKNDVYLITQIDRKVHIRKPLVASYRDKFRWIGLMLTPYISSNSSLVLNCPSSLCFLLLPSLGYTFVQLENVVAQILTTHA